MLRINKSWLYFSYINLVLNFCILSLLRGDFIFIFSCLAPKDEMRVSSFIVDLYIVLIKKAQSHLTTLSTYYIQPYKKWKEKKKMHRPVHLHFYQKHKAANILNTGCTRLQANRLLMWKVQKMSEPYIHMIVPKIRMRANI